ncbi:S41 family peptidase [Peribacillus frigoritolerans]|uniref:lmo1851 family serine protease n=1 Tax=Peribacillus frigoritolerans TaxID=450367 RepID=UPI000A4131CA|nr:S41 family peptidase [Peribacillus frigoritolerans]MCY8936710.1 S41 family peptidase [Peribacillus frigoritolerans]MCY9005036.1 S41 family peptidase [Peribacillus frigoritolerans]MDP9740588.1 carboxyl-terminal processing protease [Bacillus sp. B2I3]TWE04760.1 carboxyl-terminal processing protease [Peribacillus frigoritolerans]
MEEENQKQPKEAGKFIKMKKFTFIMGIFLVIFLTAGITTIALTFGDEKVESLAPDKHAEFEKLYSTYDKIKDDYYEEVDEEKLVDGAINGMIKSLDDPYSAYMDKKEASSFHESISSSFEGIGAEIQEQDGQIMVVSPIKGSPAEKAGVKPNDIILSVDGKSVEGLSSSEAVLKIRGEKGTKVDLSISRAGESEPIKLTIKRDTIPIETVYAEMLDDGVAKIQVTSFSEHTVQELKTALEEMSKKDMKGLVLDLRGNPGGLLDQAIEMASLFIPNGKVVLQVEDRSGKKDVYKSENDGELKIPVVVLIDDGSASASEIVAAAVSESADIPLIGVKSFGKGTVQTAQDFEDGSNFKYTAAKWLTPEGNWIHKKGIKPDINVKLPDYASLPYISPDKELKASDSSSEVKAAEEMLKEAGHDPGKIDGFFDEATKNAVTAFQREQKIKETGTIKDDTTVKLMQVIREKILKNDTQVKKAVEVLKKEINK